MSDEGTKYVGAQVEAGSEMYEQFEEFRRREGHQSNSEAVRALIRQGVMEEADRGPLSTMFGLAERELFLQIKLLGWMLTFAAVTLGAFEFGLVGGVLWLAPAAFFLLIAASTALGALFGIFNAVDPTPSPPAEDDEVEA